MIKLIHGDCTTELDRLIKEYVKIDLVLTDPPYGTLRKKWDKPLQFEKLWPKLNILGTSTYTTLLFGSEPFSTSLRNSNLNDYKYDLYWIKNRSTGFQQCANQPLKNIELISVFSKGVTNHKKFSSNRMTYNPQGLKVVNKKISNARKKWSGIMDLGDYHKDEYIQKYTNYPKMTISFDTVPIRNAVHLTQKPVPLLEYLIKTYSNENDTVLDLTMGSGSTGVACLNTNRNFIGIEIDEEYYNIAEQRIMEIKDDKINTR